MKVLVTGASGFVGSHTVKALVDKGHRVRTSARSKQRVRQALDALGVPANTVEVVEADVADAARVRNALTGCEAVVHAAAVYSHDARRGAEMLAANPRGTELVLGQACELGLDPVIYVSSFVALLPATVTLTADSPVGRPPTPYARSKARAEQIARRLQAQRAPVTTIYPGMVWGPDDPAFGESTRMAHNLLAGRVPFGAPGQMPVVDVRDVAAVLAAALRPGQGPRRYHAAAETVPMSVLMRTVAEAGGRRPPRGTAPAPLLLGLARLADTTRRLAPNRLPLDYQGIWTALNCPAVDASATVRDLQVEFRPVAQTLADTARGVAGRTT